MQKPAAHCTAVIRGPQAIMLTNQGAILELSGRQTGLIVNLDLSGLALRIEVDVPAGAVPHVPSVRELLVHLVGRVGGEPERVQRDVHQRGV